MEKAAVGLDSRGQSGSRRNDMPPALWKLYVRLGRESDVETGRRLASMALEIAPHSIEALDLYVELTPRSERATLGSHYEAFLAAVPCHPQAPRVRDALIEVLLEHGDYDRALRHVGGGSLQSLPRLDTGEIARACDVLTPPEVELEPPSVEPFEELELDFDPFEFDAADTVYEVEDHELSDAAE